MICGGYVDFSSLNYHFTNAFNSIMFGVFHIPLEKMGQCAVRIISGILHKINVYVCYFLFKTSINLKHARFNTY